MKRLIAVAIFIIALTIVVLVHHSTPAKSVAAAPCSGGAHPCIALLDESGKVFAQVNDFRFGPQGCIYYRLTTADKFQEHCGGYTMKWIGPGNAPGARGNV